MSSGIASCFQTTEFEESVSYLTGRKIVRNLSPDIVLLRPQETWERAAVLRSIAALDAEWEEYKHRSGGPHCRALIKDLGQFGDAAAIQRFLVEVLPSEEAWRLPVTAAPWNVKDKTVIRRTLVALNACNAIAFPNSLAFLPQMRLECHQTICDSMLSLAVKMQYNGNTLRIFMQYLRRVLLARTGIADVGDLTPEVIPEDVGQLRGTFFKVLVVAQRDLYGNRVTHDEGAFEALRSRRAKTKSRDLEFNWASEGRPDLEKWRALTAEYIAQVDGSSLVTRRSAVGKFLSYLGDTPQVPRDPVTYLTGSSRDYPSYESYVVSSYEDESMKLGGAHTQSMRAVRLFLQWVIATRLTSEDDQGRPVLMPGTFNPVAEQKRQAGSSLAETIREAMPPKLMRRALEILTRNDWEIAKSRHPNGVGGDWYQWRNPETGEFEEVWSPVRAIALYTKLRMPFRTMQVRTMDDGSFDTYVIDPVSHEMHLNTSLLASGSPGKPVQRGAVQTVQDRKTGTTILTCRLTTNKTADINKDAWNKGYTCPWLPDDVAEKLLWLANWQKRHNPVDRLTPWRKLREFQNSKTDDVLVGMQNCFLFRAPTNKYGRQDEPISNDDVMWLWVKVNTQLEKELEAEGSVGLDGTPIKLITGWNVRSGQPAQALYDLHALRVSIITNLLETGQVTPDMMMKVVGHATVVMTLYYTKHSAMHISDALHRADQKMLDGAQENWTRHLRSLQYKDMRRAIVANSEIGAERFSEAASGNLLRLSIGVCPVGGTQCHVGGAKIGGRVDNVYGPVPGGRNNCAGCRFGISGEPFLHGIQSEFNARSFEVTGLHRARAKAEDNFEMLDAGRRQCALTGVPFPQVRELDRASDDLEEMDSRLAQLATEMANLMGLQEQVHRIVEERLAEGAEGLALVAGDLDSVRIALEETNESDLADRLCEAAVFYPSLAARGGLTELAAHFRGQRYDRALRREKLDPRFLDLDPETSTYVGNRLTQFLELNIGRPATMRMLEGNSSLSEEAQRRGLLPDNFLHEVSHELDNILGGSFILPGRGGDRPLLN